MKVRDSGMPDEAYWESLVDPERTLASLGLDGGMIDVAEVGCGYGTFTIPAARRVRGAVTAFDIEPDMAERTRSRAAQAGLSNVRAVVRDVLQDGAGLPDGSQDACLLFNILHTESPVALLAEAARIVKPGGLVLVTHWRYDETTPRGPSLDIRPRPEDIVRWAIESRRLRPGGAALDLPPFHFGLRLVRTI